MGYNWSKGAVPGRVIEKVLGPYDGQIFLDSTFVGKIINGNLETVSIGPSSIWKNLVVTRFTPK